MNEELMKMVTSLVEGDKEAAETALSAYLQEKSRSVLEMSFAHDMDSDEFEEEMDHEEEEHDDMDDEHDEEEESHDRYMKTNKKRDKKDPHVHMDMPDVHHMKEAAPGHHPSHDRYMKTNMKRKSSKPHMHMNEPHVEEEEMEDINREVEEYRKRLMKDRRRGGSSRRMMRTGNRRMSGPTGSTFGVRMSEGEHRDVVDWSDVHKAAMKTAKAVHGDADKKMIDGMIVNAKKHKPDSTAAAVELVQDMIRSKS